MKSIVCLLVLLQDEESWQETVVEFQWSGGESSPNSLPAVLQRRQEEVL